MRDAFGGTFMIELMLIFLAIYIAFIAVALNYAKAFKVKNEIINIIEQNEGIDDYNNNTGVIGKINSRLQSMSYYVKIENRNNQLNDNTHCYEEGYCIIETNSTINGINASYYEVVTYIRIELPFFGLNFTVPIQGETRMIERIGAE